MLQELNADLSMVADSVRRSLVHVHCGRHGSGAGTVWQSDGLIVTNAHVVGGRSISVELPDGRTLPARVLAQDPARDVAALKVETSGLPTIPQGDSRAVRAGQWVMAIGHPWGVEGAATGGIVIGVGSEWPETPRDGRAWVMVSLHMRPGHSGGALVDAEGRLVGINTMINGPDVGVAIPTHVVVDFLRRNL
jgi:S1-C subfamily serine protease